jgi:broad specificity phosphatase PhoE
VRRVLIAAVVAAAVLSPAVARAQKIVFVVRHAERADAGAGMAGMTAQPDPPLSAAGMARARKLAGLLADAGITAIYTTEFLRTQQTAQPLADRLKIAEQHLSSKDTAGLVAAIRRQHPQDVVLVVGHGNTVPDIIRAFGGPAITLGDNEYDNLFIVVPATGAMTRIKF